MSVPETVTLPMSWEGDAATVVGLVTRSAPIPSKLKIESTATNLVNFVLNTHPSLFDRAKLSNSGILEVILHPNICCDNQTCDAG
ncbi:hypothetical protein AOA80_10870 [Methanomassiliicoccales archaeon RumEn M1]|nr:hypothetical protein AOA80_10870 [Methanomassiliicoccales archaeon RumEn M1]